jgi:hypothetical protein
MLDTATTSAHMIRTILCMISSPFVDVTLCSGQYITSTHVAITEALQTLLREWDAEAEFLGRSRQRRPAFVRGKAAVRREPRQRFAVGDTGRPFACDGVAGTAPGRTSATRPRRGRGIPFGYSARTAYPTDV